MTEMNEDKQKITELERRIASLERKLESETKGRTHAEKALRARLIDSKNSFGYFKQVGVVHSCFPQKFGTPRQGLLVSDTRGCIEIDEKIIGVGALKGLEEYSHLWIISVFHENTNMHKMNNQTAKFKSFTQPPQAGGMRIDFSWEGLFATRSPHRPSPLGLSLVKISRIEGAKVFVQGLDLVDSTPVLDIKPYTPRVDSPAQNDMMSNTIFTPKWLDNPVFNRVQIRIGDEAVLDLKELVSNEKLKWYTKDEFDTVVKTVKDLLSLDPRGIIHGRGTFEEDDQLKLQREKFVMRFDTLRIEFSPSLDGSRCIRITRISLYDEPEN